MTTPVFRVGDRVRERLPPHDSANVTEVSPDGQIRVWWDGTDSEGVFMWPADGFERIESDADLVVHLRAENKRLIAKNNRLLERIKSYEHKFDCIREYLESR